MKPVQLLASVLAVSTVTSAWPWPPSLGDLKAIAQENGLYQKRQDNSGGNNGGNGGDNDGGNGGNNNSNNAPASSAAPSSGSAAPSSGSAAPPSSGSAQPSGSQSGSNSAPAPTDSASGSDAPASSGNATSSDTNTYTGSIAADAQPGGINMIQPNTQSTATQYYKVDQTITWIWNYTSLARPPSAIDIVATVSGAASQAAPSPFTLAQNYSFAPTETFTWDTGKYVNETSALPVGTYTLMVYDADAPGGMSATASPGYLAPFNQFRFGMYTGQPATPLARPYMCATCNSATGLKAGTLWTVVITGSLTVASFIWFAGGWGVLS